MHIKQFLSQAVEICQQINHEALEAMVDDFVRLRNNQGRLFILGAGGSAANASHAVNDFRKLCGIEAYAPTDNVSELTARTNDEGWPSVFVEWLKISRLSAGDAILVFSVGGGCEENNVSVNIVNALKEAKNRQAKIYGIVGRNGGYTAKVADRAIIIPTADDKHVTPHSEAFQALLWHGMVSHPKLQIMKTKW
jgi:D-sedoheptulose 7-phosphate isomerase